MRDLGRYKYVIALARVCCEGLITRGVIQL